MSQKEGTDRSQVSGLKRSNSKKSANAESGPKSARYQKSRNKLIQKPSVSMIPTIHAYNPKGLKNLKISNPKEYKQFYKKQQSSQSSRLYTYSFLSHFREYRKNIRQKICQQIDQVCSSQNFDENKIKLALNQIKKETKYMKESTESILESKKSDYSYQQLKRQKDSFKALSQYIAHLFEMLKIYQKYIVQVNKIMDEEINQVEFSLSKLKKLSKQYKDFFISKFLQSSTHSQSSLFKNSGTRLKQKFSVVEKEALHIINKILKLKELHERLQILGNKQKNKDQLEQYVNSKYFYQVFEAINQKNTVVQEMKKASYLMKSQNVHNFIVELQQEIISLADNLFENLQRDFRSIMSYLHVSLVDYGLEEIIEKGYQDFGECLTVMKILLSIFEMEEKQKTHTYIIKNFITLFKDEKFKQIKKVGKKLQDGFTLIKQAKDMENLCILKEIIMPNLKIHYKIANHICSWFLHIVNSGILSQELIIDYPIKEAVFEEMEVLNKFISKIDQLKTYEGYLCQNLRSRGLYGHYDNEKKMIEQEMNKNSKVMSILNEQLFTKLEESCQELQSIINHETVVFFMRQSSYNLEWVNSLNMIEEFKRYADQIKPQIQEQPFQKIFTIMFEYMRKVQQAQAVDQKNYLVNYLTIIYENSIGDYLIDLIQNVNDILYHPINQKFTPQPFKTLQKYSYEARPKVKQYLSLSQKLFLKLIGNIKNVQSFLPTVLESMISNIRYFVKRQMIYQSFKNTAGQTKFYPSISIMEDWLNWEFSYSIQKTIPQSIITSIRKEKLLYFECLINRLQIMKYKMQSFDEGGEEIFNQCERRKKLIQKFIIPILENRSCRYQTYAQNICSFLRANNMPHTILYTKNGDIMTFFSEADYNMEQLRYKVEKKLSMTPGLLRNLNEGNLFTKIQMQDNQWTQKSNYVAYKVDKVLDLQSCDFKSIISDIEKQAKQREINFIQDEQIQKHDKKDPQSSQFADFEGENKQDSGIQEQNKEFSGLDKQNTEKQKIEENKQTQKEEVLENEKIDGHKQLQGSEKRQEQNQKEDSLKEQSKKEQDQQEKEQMKEQQRGGQEGQGNKSQKQQGKQQGKQEQKQQEKQEQKINIWEKIDIEILALVLNKGEGDNILKVCKHLNQCKQLQGIAIDSIQLVDNLLQNLMEDNDFTQRINIFHQILSQMNITYNILYGSQKGHNLIILFHLPNTQKYCHVFLEQPQPINTQSFGLEVQLEKHQLMICNSLFYDKKTRKQMFQSIIPTFRKLNNELINYSKKFNDPSDRLKKIYVQTQKQNIRNLNEFQAKINNNLQKWVEIGEERQKMYSLQEPNELNLEAYNTLKNEILRIYDNEGIPYVKYVFDDIILFITHQQDPNTQNALIGKIFPQKYIEECMHKKNYEQIEIKIEGLFLKEEQMDPQIFKEFFEIQRNHDKVFPLLDILRTQISLMEQTEQSVNLSVSDEFAEKMSILTGKKLIDEEVLQQAYDKRRQKIQLLQFLLEQIDGLEVTESSKVKEEDFKRVTDENRKKFRLGDEFWKNIHKQLSLNSCKHLVVKFAGQFIGLAAIDTSPQDAIKLVLDCSLQCIEYQLQNQTDFDVLEISKIKLSLCLQEIPPHNIDGFQLQVKYRQAEQTIKDIRKQLFNQQFIIELISPEAITFNVLIPPQLIPQFNRKDTMYVLDMQNYGYGAKFYINFLRQYFLHSAFNLVQKIIDNPPLPAVPKWTKNVQIESDDQSNISITLSEGMPNFIRGKIIDKKDSRIKEFEDLLPTNKKINGIFMIGQSKESKY